MKFCADSKVFFQKLNLKHFVTFTSIASVFLNGYTYSYITKEPINGEECCLPIKSKCGYEENLGYVCKMSRGQIKCGKGCSRIVNALGKLEKREKKKKEKEKSSVMMHHDAAPKNDTSSLFHSYPIIGYKREKVSSSFESYEEHVSQEKHAKKAVYGGGGGKGLKVEEGQKLTQKQLQMLETVAEEKLGNSTNPLCKDPESSIYRSSTIFVGDSSACGCCSGAGKPRCHNPQTTIHKTSYGQKCEVERCKSKQPIPKEKVLNFVSRLFVRQNDILSLPSSGGAHYVTIWVLIFFVVVDKKQLTHYVNIFGKPKFQILNFYLENLLFSSRFLILAF